MKSDEEKLIKICLSII